MTLIRRYGILLFIFVSSDAYAQIDSINFLLKNNPFAQFNGEIKFSVEKSIKPTVSIEATWGFMKYYRNVTIMGNTFTINQNNAKVLKANGSNFSIYLKKYLRKQNWLNGVYAGIGFALFKDHFDYKFGGGLTGITEDRDLVAKNVGLRTKLGYQTRLNSNIFLDLSMGAGYNFTENNDIITKFNNRYKKGLTAEYQFRLVTAIQAKDTNSRLAKNKVKGSLWLNPAAFFRSSIYAGGMFKWLPKYGTYATIEGFYYPRQFVNQAYLNQKIKVFGFILGSRNYMNKECKGGYAGLFAGYNHLEFSRYNYNWSVLKNPIPIGTTIKDQITGGFQFGYVIRTSNKIFIDFGFHTGMRFGNQPLINQINQKQYLFDFSNGSYNKILIKIGGYI